MATSLAEKKLPQRVRDSISRTIAPFLHVRGNGKGRCSDKTAADRKQTISLCAAELWVLGFHIEKLESLAGKHVDALMKHWQESDLSLNGLHTRLSMLRVLAKWLGKTGIVRNITDYVPENTAKRTGIATKLRTWASKSVAPEEVISSAMLIDERLSCLLALQDAFGLRVKESLEMKPSYAVIENGTYLQIHEGTKGGKMRTIRIRSDRQKKVIEWAIRISGSGKRMRWPGKSFKQSQNRFYNLCRKKLGVSGKGLGITPHGLRHGFADRGYTEQTGRPTPLNGGSPANIDWQTHHYANVTMSHELGHIRTNIVASYYGTFGHALRKSGKRMPLAFPIY